MKSRPSKWVGVAGVAVGLANAAVIWFNGNRPTRASPLLVKLLSSNDPERVGSALRTLADYRDPVAVPAALPLLKSEDPWVWIHAALYLGAVRRPEAVPYLIKAGLIKCEWAHDDAGHDLRAITGQDFGTDFEKWRQWWEKSNPGASFDFEKRPVPTAE